MFVYNKKQGQCPTDYKSNKSKINAIGSKNNAITIDTSPATSPKLAGLLFLGQHPFRLAREHVKHLSLL